MSVMAEGEAPNPVADELLSRVAIDTPESRQAVAGGASMFLIDPDRAQKFIDDIRTAAATLTAAGESAGRARWNYPPEADRVERQLRRPSREDVRQRRCRGRPAPAGTGQDVANELQRQLNAYQQVEQANTPGMRA